MHSFISALELRLLTILCIAACTCPGESHPGPVRSDGSYVGRAAPEIDVLEALVEDGEGRVSLSRHLATITKIEFIFR